MVVPTDPEAISVPLEVADLAEPLAVLAEAVAGLGVADPVALVAEPVAGLGVATG